jgi:nucleotidyltransferase substrate binding protein (TIGR01987 family)
VLIIDNTVIVSDTLYFTISSKEAYHQGLIEYDDAWIKEMVETRNKTVHTYNEDLAEEVYAALPNILGAFKKLLDELRNKA